MSELRQPYTVTSTETPTGDYIYVDSSSIDALIGRQAAEIDRLRAENEALRASFASGNKSKAQEQVMKIKNCPTNALPQEYFWTRAWQEGEGEADADIATGRTRQFSDVEEAIAWLRSDEP